MPDIFNSKPQEKFETKELKPVERIHKPIKSLHPEPKGEERHKLLGHSHNPLSAFSYFPDHVKFINADPEEKIVLLLRRHPITNLKWLATSFFMFLLPSFFPLLTFFELLPEGFQTTVSLMWYLITTAFILEQFLKWFFQVNIITDERIIEVDFLSLFYREITDANIDQIQDVTPRVGGGIRTFFNYGDVIIQTAAAVPLITFEAVPNPDRVARILRESRVEEEQEKIEGRVR